MATAQENTETKEYLIDMIKTTCQCEGLEKYVEKAFSSGLNKEEISEIIIKEVERCKRYWAEKKCRWKKILKLEDKQEKSYSLLLKIIQKEGLERYLNYLKAK
jgi:hypothetical protein